jgi:pimeloyl-ACP methyl ester carboxylesterase
MIEMPPLQFAQVNGIRMGYYEAGPKSDKPPLISCHGWPEIAFSWRHQIKALSEAGIRVIAPDQARLWRDRPARSRSRPTTWSI